MLSRAVWCYDADSYNMELLNLIDMRLKFVCLAPCYSLTPKY